MYSWINEPPQATWSEIATLFLENYKCLTYSEIDRQEIPAYYTKAVPSVPIGGKGFGGVEFAPITFLSVYFLQSKKGIFILNLTQPSLQDLLLFLNCRILHL